MSQSNSQPITNPDPSFSSGFSAQSQMGLPEVLQMCCLSRRSGQITFRSGQSNGFIFIQQGRVLHAMCGPLEGEEAIYTMLTWPGGGFTLDEDILPHKKTVTLTWEQLLFEGARRADQGFTSSVMSGGPVTTAEPATSHRPQESQPKLTITRPDLPPVTCELNTEYTHVGRVPGNELVLPYPSISSRHCIFILSGPDVVVRDLNSSNGTMVNGEAINEVVLRPGDTVQVGVVQMKFEAGIKRPKLQPAATPTADTGKTSLKAAAASRPITYETVKLPEGRKRAQPEAVPDDKAFVSGRSAISYDNLAKPEEPEKKFPVFMVLAAIGVLGMLVAAYFVFFKH